MLPKLQENTDWRAKYQDVLKVLEARELEWGKIETLLRKAIGRLSIAGGGLDDRLDKQLRIIQALSREKRDEKLPEALTRLSDVVAALDDPKPAPAITSSRFTSVPTRPCPGPKTRGVTASLSPTRRVRRESLQQWSMHATHPTRSRH